MCSPCGERPNGSVTRWKPASQLPRLPFHVPVVTPCSALVVQPWHCREGGRELHRCSSMAPTALITGGAGYVGLRCARSCVLSLGCRREVGGLSKVGHFGQFRAGQAEFCTWLHAHGLAAPLAPWFLTSSSSLAAARLLTRHSRHRTAGKLPGNSPGAEVAPSEQPQHPAQPGQCCRRLLCVATVR